LRPSTIIALYSFFSAIFDGFQARTLFLLNTSTPLFSTFIAGTCVKIILLILESCSKRAFLKDPYNSLSEEELGGVFSVNLLWWINALIVKGYKTLLSADDLPKIDTHLSTELCRDEFQKAWNSRCVFLVN
jgi:ATP-binding cassette subfamily C (CFTR/MRP) protein 1